MQFALVKVWLTKVIEQKGFVIIPFRTCTSDGCLQEEMAKWSSGAGVMSCIFTHHREPICEDCRQAVVMETFALKVYPCCRSQKYASLSLVIYKITV